MPPMYFEKGKRQNNLRPEDIDRIVDTYRERKEDDRYSRRVSMDEIARNDYNLNISRYVSTAKDEEEIDLETVNGQLIEIEKRIAEATSRHNQFLIELGLPLLPG